MWSFMSSLPTFLLHPSFAILQSTFFFIYIHIYFGPKYKTQNFLTTLHNFYKAKKNKRLYNLFNKSKFSSIILAESFEARWFSSLFLFISQFFIFFLLGQAILFFLYDQVFLSFLFLHNSIYIFLGILDSSFCISLAQV